MDNEINGVVGSRRDMLRGNKFDFLIYRLKVDIRRRRCHLCLFLLRDALLLLYMYICAIGIGMKLGADNLLNLIYYHDKIIFTNFAKYIYRFINFLPTILLVAVCIIGFVLFLIPSYIYSLDDGKAIRHYLLYPSVAVTSNYKAYISRLYGRYKILSKTTHILRYYRIPLLIVMDYLLCKVLIAVNLTGTSTSILIFLGQVVTLVFGAIMYFYLGLADKKTPFFIIRARQIVYDSDKHSHTKEHTGHNTGDSYDIYTPGF